MAYLNETKAKHWDSKPVDEDTLKNVFAHAYREKRRVEAEEGFEFYSSEAFDLPGCMRLKSLPIALTLRFNGDMLKELEAHNADGEKK